MILVGLFTVGTAIVTFNYGFMRGYEAKEKDGKEVEEFWREVERHERGHSL